MNSPPYMPTPQQIKAGCAKIREGWSERTHRLRAGVAIETIDDPYEFPQVAAKDLFGTIDLDE